MHRTDNSAATGDLIGYARVSTADQDAHGQIAALKEAGCSRIFTDHISGTTHRRPQLDAALDHLRPGDVLVVWRLDRLGRSLPHLLDVVQALDGLGVEFRSLSEPGMNTTDAGGRLLFTVAAAFATFERDLISERTRLGLARARAQGRNAGRPPALTTADVEDITAARSRGRSISELARQHGVSRTTIRRALDRWPGSSSSAQA